MALSGELYCLLYLLASCLVVSNIGNIPGLRDDTLQAYTHTLILSYNQPIVLVESADYSGRLLHQFLSNKYIVVNHTYGRFIKRRIGEI